MCIPFKISGPCKLTEIRMIEGRRKLGEGIESYYETKIRERERERERETGLPLAINIYMCKSPFT